MRPVNRAGFYALRRARPFREARDRLLLDDGRIELRVVASSAAGLDLVVVHGGDLGAHKGINAPGVALPASALTDKDVEDLRFGLTLGVDVVALSFVQTAEDVARARAIISEAGRPTPIIAKIERPAAIENLDAILRLVQGVMVARGDLGLEMPSSRCRACRRRSFDPRARLACQQSWRHRCSSRCASIRGRPAPRSATRPIASTRRRCDHAGRRDGGRRVSGQGGADARRGHPRCRVAAAGSFVGGLRKRPGRGRHAREPAWAGVGAGGGHPRDDWSGGRDRGSHDRGTHGPAVIGVSAAPILAAIPDGQIAGALSLLWGVAPVVTAERNIDRLTRSSSTAAFCQLARSSCSSTSVPEQDRTDANFLHVRRISAPDAP